METRTETAPSSYASPALFHAYLRKSNVRARLLSNIDQFISQALPESTRADTGSICRFFNDLSSEAEYAGFQPLLDCIKMSGPLNEKAVKTNSSTFQHWLDFALVAALHDLFDLNGDIRNEIYAALNQKTILDQLTSKYEVEEIKSMLLYSYILMLGELAAPKILETSSFEDITEAKPKKQVTPLFSKALTGLKDKIPHINEKNINALNMQLASSIAYSQFEPALLKDAIKHHLQARKNELGTIKPMGTALLSGLKNTGHFLSWAGQAMLYGLKYLVSCRDPVVEEAYPPATVQPKSIKLPPAPQQDDIEMTTPKTVRDKGKAKIVNMEEGDFYFLSNALGLLAKKSSIPSAESDGELEDEIKAKPF